MRNQEDQRFFAEPSGGRDCYKVENSQQTWCLGTLEIFHSLMGEAGKRVDKVDISHFSLHWARLCKGDEEVDVGYCQC